VLLGRRGRGRSRRELAEEVGLLGELRQMRSRVDELYEWRGETGEARNAFSRATQTLNHSDAEVMVTKPESLPGEIERLEPDPIVCEEMFSRID
jgi:hypothetical protein